MPNVCLDWCRTLGNYTPPRSLRESAGFAAGFTRESSMTAKPPRLPDPRLPNPNVTLLQRQRQQVLPLPLPLRGERRGARDENAREAHDEAHALLVAIGE